MVTIMDLKLNNVEKTATVSLFSDTKSEVTNDMNVKGLPEGYTIAQGSSVMTSSAEIAFMKSDGTWNWV